MPMMTKCKACGEVISDDALTCPKCGNPHKKPKKPFFSGCGTGIVILLLLLIAIWLFGGGVVAVITGG